MDFSNLDEQGKFSGVDPQIVDYLIKMAFAEDDLTDVQKLCWGIKNGYIPIDADEEIADQNYGRPISMEEAVKAIRASCGAMTIEKVYGILEKAEAKIQTFVWKAINAALFQTLPIIVGKPSP